MPVIQHGSGILLKTEGDSLMVMYRNADDAITLHDGARLDALTDAPVGVGAAYSLNYENVTLTGFAKTQAP